MTINDVLSGVVRLFRREEKYVLQKETAMRMKARFAESKRLIKEAVKLADLFQDLCIGDLVQVMGNGRYVLNLVGGGTFCLNQRACSEITHKGPQETLEFFSVEDLRQNFMKAMDFERAAKLVLCDADHFRSTRRRLWRMRPLRVSCFYFARSKFQQIGHAIREWAMQPADSASSSHSTWN
jgi:hypothetical protein